MAGLRTLLAVAAALAVAGPASAGEGGARLAEAVDVGGEVRLRPEGWWDFDLRADRRSDTAFVGLRTRLDVDILLRDDVDLFVRVQDSRRFAEENPSGADPGVLLKEGWVRWSGWWYLAGVAVDATLGRQAIAVGDGRIVGDDEWGEVGRSFDAVRLDARLGEAWRATGFIATPAEGDASAGPGRDDDRVLIGLVLSPALPRFDHVDLYALGISDPGGRGAGGADEEFWTLGGEARAPIGPSWTLGGAAAGQFGRDGVNRRRSFAARARLVRALPVDLLKAVAVEAAVASGDPDLSDAKTESFRPLFPSGHDANGWADLVGDRNVVTWRASLRGDLLPGLSWGADWHRFRRHRSGDDFAHADGTPWGYPANGRSGLAQEVDLVLRWDLPGREDRFSVEAGAGRFLLDRDLRAALRARGWAPRDARFAYLQTEVRF